MSERRPHWDDDLTDAVFRALSHTYRAQGWAGGIAIDLDESVYPLIAAVEDWQASSAFSAIVDSEGDCRCGDSGVFLCPEHTRQEWLAWIVGGAS